MRDIVPADYRYHAHRESSSRRFHLDSPDLCTPHVRELSVLGTGKLQLATGKQRVAAVPPSAPSSLPLPQLERPSCGTGVDAVEIQLDAPVVGQYVSHSSSHSIFKPQVPRLRQGISRSLRGGRHAHAVLHFQGIPGKRTQVPAELSSTAVEYRRGGN